MPRRRSALLGGLESFFGIDDDWERVPADPARARRTDIVLAGVITVLGAWVSNAPAGP